LLPELCLTAAHLTVVAGGFGGIVALVAGLVGHGVLRPLLEARGVSPWTVRDSLGSMPLILLGSLLVGACSGVLIAEMSAKCSYSVMLVAFLCTIITLALLMIKLGLVALKKLV
jgi:hypothetical protein